MRVHAEAQLAFVNYTSCYVRSICDADGRVPLSFDGRVIHGGRSHHYLSRQSAATWTMWQKFEGRFSLTMASSSSSRH